MSSPQNAIPPISPEDALPAQDIVPQMADAVLKPKVIDPPALATLSDDMRLAIEMLQSTPGAALADVLQINHLPMEYVGQVSVGTMGDADLACFGYARHELNEQLVYLNVAGPKTLVESMRSHIFKGNTITLREGDEAVRLVPDVKLEKGAPSAYTTFEYAEAAARVRHVVMIHRRLYESLPGHPQHYLIQADQQSLMRIVAEETGLPLLAEWSPILWRLAENARLVTPCKASPIPFYRLTTNKALWRKAIQAALNENILTF